MSYLRYLRIVVSNTYCVVFIPIVYHMLPVSLDCPFLILVFSNIYIYMVCIISFSRVIWD